MENPSSFICCSGCVGARADGGRKGCQPICSPSRWRAELGIRSGEDRRKSLTGGSKSKSHTDEQRIKGGDWAIDAHSLCFPVCRTTVQSFLFFSHPSVCCLGLCPSPAFQKKKKKWKTSNEALCMDADSTSVMVTTKVMFGCDDSACRMS